MMNTKSPFFIMQDSISPKLCMDIRNSLKFDGRRDIHSGINQERIYAAMRNNGVVEEVCTWFDVKNKGVTPISFESFPESSSGAPKSWNSRYLRQKWVRVHNFDITFMIFLTSHNKTRQFDKSFESYGGKVEFPQYNFGFTPEIGTLIAFPSVPHFINLVTEVKVGCMQRAVFHVSGDLPYLHNPKLFIGSPTEWFEEFD